MIDQEPTMNKSIDELINAVAPYLDRHHVLHAALCHVGPEHPFFKGLKAEFNSNNSTVREIFLAWIAMTNGEKEQTK